MALPLAKLTLLVGAGLVGSYYANEGRLPSVTDAVKGVFKIVLSNNDTGKPVSKPSTDPLLKKVEILRREIESMAKNGSVTIVNAGGGTGAKKYSLIIVVVVAGYGYVWWKGWKLPDLMFATKRSLSDACNSVAKQLEDVYSSISTAQRHLSTKINSVDQDVNKIVEISQVTKEEVSLLRGRSRLIGEEFQSVRDVVQTLESKLSEIEGKQDITALGVKALCDCALKNAATTERIQASPYSSSRAALESPARTGSLPPTTPLALPSPSDANGSQKFEWLPKNGSGLKEFNGGVLEVVEALSSPKVSDGTQGSFNGLLGRYSSASVLTRSRSVTNSVTQQVLSRGA